MTRDVPSVLDLFFFPFRLLAMPFCVLCAAILMLLECLGKVRDLDARELRLILSAHVLARNARVELPADRGCGAWTCIIICATNYS